MDMKEPRERELIIDTIARFVTYDTQSGEVLHVHEFQGEPETRESFDKAQNMEMVLRIAARDFGNRNLKVMEVPPGFEIKPGIAYRVDPGSGTFVESSDLAKTFRGALKQQGYE
jgi:archaellum biogenesis ATPase FlaH